MEEVAEEVEGLKAHDCCCLKRRFERPAPLSKLPALHWSGPPPKEEVGV